MSCVFQRRRVSFAESVEEHHNSNDTCGERRYFTSPRSKLHSKLNQKEFPCILVNIRTSNNIFSSDR